MTNAEERVRQIMHDGDRAAWSSPALVLAVSEGRGDDPRWAAEQVLRALGLAVQDLGEMDRDGLTAQAAAPVLQTAGVLRGEAAMWSAQSDDAPLAQGRASAKALPRSPRSGYKGWRDDAQAQTPLRDAGLADVATMPTPPDAPAVTVGRRTPD